MTYRQLHNKMYEKLLGLTRGDKKIEFTHGRFGGWVFTITAKRDNENK